MVSTNWNGVEVSHSMPSGAHGVAAGIIVYTVICLLAGLVFVLHVLHHDSRFLYISLFAYGSTLMTVTALMQEINFLVNWYPIMVDSWEQAKVAAYQPALSFGPQAKGFQKGLFWVQIYAMNFVGLVITFWAINLCFKTWHIRFGPLHKHHDQVTAVAKWIAFIVPAIFVICQSTIVVDTSIAGLIVLNYFILFFCLVFTIGGLLLILTKCAMTFCTKHGFTFRKNTSANSNVGNHNLMPASSSLVDQWMVSRFVVAAMIICAYNAYLIFYSTHTYRTILSVAHRDAPDFSLSETITSWVEFIPLTTLSLIAFLLFGTTALAIDEYRVTYHNVRNRLFHRRRTINSRDDAMTLTGPSVVELEKGQSGFMTMAVHTS